METSYKDNNTIITGIVWGPYLLAFLTFTRKCDAGRSITYGNFIRGNEYSVFLDNACSDVFFKFSDTTKFIRMKDFSDEF
ncbi:hypothetical protein [Oceanobacillus sp. CF4.6]|uniref:hypothetical protein n=1 Tax=Oceanobacillus sp. CF4.6 TaxID=3373080 RepID=UPI003EE5D3B6